MNIVRVALAVPLPRFFDYLYAPDLTPIVGGRVLVPFGSQKRVGIVVDLPASSDVAKEKLKPIIDVLDTESLFNSTTWDWLAWSANYYRAALGDVLFQALPVKLRNGESAVKNDRTFWRITELGKQALESGELKRAKKQIEALSLLLTQDLEKGNNEISSAIWSALKGKDYVEEIIVPTEQKSWQQALGIIL